MLGYHSNMVEDSNSLRCDAAWFCVRCLERFGGLQMKELQSFEMMGTSHSLTLKDGAHTASFKGPSPYHALNTFHLSYKN
jgi:hypothetical protein